MCLCRNTTTEWKFQQNYGFLPASDSVSAALERRPPPAFQSEPLGVSPCDLIFPENSPETSGAQALTWCSLLCKTSSTTNRSLYRKMSNLALMVVLVLQPVHSTRASSTVCVCVQPRILFIQPGYYCLMWTNQTFSPNLILLSIQIFVTNSSSRAKISCLQTFSNLPVTVSLHKNSIKYLTAPDITPTTMLGRLWQEL